MSEYNCPECKDTGEYRGLNTVEPCRACGPKLNLAVGHPVDVLIQGPVALVACAIGMVIDRPLFGLPAKCFILSHVEWGKGQRIIGRLECVSIDGDGDIVTIPNSAGEPVSFPLYRATSCDGVSFTLLEDANA